MNVSAGDLAYIVKSDIPANVGKIVKVIRFHGIFRSRHDGNVALWEVEGNGLLSFIDPYSVNDFTIKKCFGSLGVPDENLRRIAGPSVDVGTETTEPTKETA